MGGAGGKGAARWTCRDQAQHPPRSAPVSYTHLRAHETPEHLVCRLLLEKKKKNTNNTAYRQAHENNIDTIQKCANRVSTQNFELHTLTH